MSGLVSGHLWPTGASMPFMTSQDPQFHIISAFICWNTSGTDWWRLFHLLTCTQQQGCASRTESLPRSPALYPWSRQELWFPVGNCHRACERSGAKGWMQEIQNSYTPSRQHKQTNKKAALAIWQLFISASYFDIAPVWLYVNKLLLSIYKKHYEQHGT